MKFIHLSDLHLGIRFKERSMLEDQRYILNEILNVIDTEKPEGVIIAGDVYDKSVPSAEAVDLFDKFLSNLAERRLQVFVISGNHDSPERIAFGSRIMGAQGIHLSPVYSGTVDPVCLTDSFGAVNVYLLPFIKPADVRRFFPEEQIGSYTDALNCAVQSMQIDPAARNIIITHQFVTGAARSDSEDSFSVGGTDNVDAAVFEAFDYVALGHLHTPQNCGSPKIRYCGTPLKYSFAEAKNQKSVTVVELGKKGDLSVRTIPLKPLRDMVEIKGKYDDLMQKSFYENTTYQTDYVHIILTDEDDVPEGNAKLRVVYQNLLALDYDNTRTRSVSRIEGAVGVESKSPLQLFAELYELQNNRPMSEEQTEFVKTLIEKVWEGKV